MASQQNYMTSLFISVFMLGVVPFLDTKEISQ